MFSYKVVLCTKCRLTAIELYYYSIHLMMVSNMYITFEERRYLKFYTIADWSARLLDSRGIARQTRP